MDPFTFVLSLVAMVMGFVYLTARAGVRRSDARYPAEDTEVVQELNRGFARMAERVEALETLLLEKGAEAPVDQALR